MVKDEMNTTSSELNEAPKEMLRYEDNQAENDFRVYESIPAEEYKEPEKVVETKKVKKQDTSSMISKISSSFMVTAAAATTVILPTVANANQPNIEVQILESYVTDTAIQYAISVSDPTAAELELVLTNDFTNRRVEIVDEVFEGSFEDLKEKMQYTMQVVMPGSFGSEKVITEVTFRTLGVEDYRTARFNGVVAECTCNVDSKFHFQMDFVDNLEAFTNFRAYLVDDKGNEFHCEFNDDLHSMQEIDLDLKILKGRTATLFIYCDKVDGDTIEQNLKLSETVHSI